MAQKLVFANALESWPKLQESIGVTGIELQPLRTGYRSTRQITRLARHILGPLADPLAPRCPREGAPVELFRFVEEGAMVAFLAEALRSLVAREPSCSAAVISRDATAALALWEALSRAEVPRLRLAVGYDFAFEPGIDVTEVAQVKGLELDYVVVPDAVPASYPDTSPARHLLHIAATRAAHQLWLTLLAPSASLVLPMGQNLPMSQNVDGEAACVRTSHHVRREADDQRAIVRLGARRPGAARAAGRARRPVGRQDTADMADRRQDRLRQAGAPRRRLRGRLAHRPLARLAGGHQALLPEPRQPLEARPAGHGLCRSGAPGAAATRRGALLLCLGRRPVEPGHLHRQGARQGGREHVHRRHGQGPEDRHIFRQLRCPAHAGPLPPRPALAQAGSWQGDRDPDEGEGEEPGYPARLRLPRRGLRRRREARGGLQGGGGGAEDQGSPGRGGPPDLARWPEEAEADGLQGAARGSVEQPGAPDDDRHPACGCRSGG
ncbi:MAG: hypothetical protein FJ125_02720 [Deltaproteobacteria bacterium]|nr:hypothetical protein [Deltaproteobacteria bacterium]